MCEQDEFCEYGHMIPFDKEIILSGFNIFTLLLQLKEILPENVELKNF